MQVDRRGKGICCTITVCHGQPHRPPFAINGPRHLRSHGYHNVSVSTVPFGPRGPGASPPTRWRVLGAVLQFCMASHDEMILLCALWFSQTQVGAAAGHSELPHAHDSMRGVARVIAQ